MGALYADAVLVDHESPVHEQDGGAPIGHDDGGPILEEQAARILDEAFGLGA